MSHFYWLIQSELESQVYDKLASMLQCMEAHEQNADVDRVNELIKVRISKIKKNKTKEINRILFIGQYAAQ